MTITDVAGAQALGIDPEKLDILLTRCRKDVDDGLLPSCQVALARDGRLAAFETFGTSTNDTRYVIFSATKAVVASAVWLLIADGSLDISKRVVDYIPEFGTNGKDVVTVEQVLLHTSGFPHAPLGPPQWSDRAQRLERFSQWRLNWEPGTRHEYHPTSAHWVLAELIERLTDTDYRRFVRGHVVDPLGFGISLGIREDELDSVAPLSPVGEPTDPDELERLLGIRELPITEVTEEALLMFNEPSALTVGVPGGGAVSTAADLALFYQGLLHNRDKIWDPDLLADATGRVRNRFPDPLTGVPANRGLGVVIAGDDGRSAGRGLGHTVSPRAFGHNGAGGQVAWADPDTGLSFVYLTNGLDRNQLREWRRSSGVASKAAVCAA